MGKIKTKRTLAKRVKFTGKGKMMRKRVRTSHLKVKIKANSKHRKARRVELNNTDSKRMRRMLPNG